MPLGSRSNRGSRNWGTPILRVPEREQGALTLGGGASLLLVRQAHAGGAPPVQKLVRRGQVAPAAGVVPHRVARQAHALVALHALALQREWRVARSLLPAQQRQVWKTVQ